MGRSVAVMSVVPLVCLLGCGGGNKNVGKLPGDRTLVSLTPVERKQLEAELTAENTQLAADEAYRNGTCAIASFALPSGSPMALTPEDGRRMCQARFDECKAKPLVVPKVDLAEIPQACTATLSDVRACTTAQAARIRSLTTHCDEFTGDGVHDTSVGLKYVAEAMPSECRAIYASCTAMSRTDGVDEIPQEDLIDMAKAWSGSGSASGSASAP